MGKKSSNNDDKLSLAEAYINFQIELKRNEIQHFQEEINELEKKKQKYIEMLEQVKKDKEGPIKALWKQAREQQKKLDQSEAVSREEVEEALEHNLNMAQSEQAQLTELRSKLSHVERQVLDLEAERQTWLQYKDTGSQEHQNQIAKLEEELVQMQRDFELEADTIKNIQECTFNDIDKKTAQSIDKKKHLAVERAIKHLDKSSKQEIKANEWLQKEIAVSIEQMSALALSVQSLEEENLQHINWLFDKRMGVFSLSRSVLHSQVVQPSDSEMQTDSPKSPTSVTGRDVGDTTKSLEGDERDRSCTSASQGHRVLLDQGQSQLKDELLHLGVPQQRWLNVVGQAVLLHPPPSEDDGQGSWGRNDQGVLTTRIIKNKFK